MKSGRIIITLSAIIYLLVMSVPASGTDYRIQTVASLPACGDGHTGISGAFSGYMDDSIIIAGGSGSSGAGPMERGHEKYYSDIHTITLRNGRYECSLAGTGLPEGIGNGCSASDGERLFCIGGHNERRRRRAVYEIKYAGSGIQVDSIAAIPDGFVPVSATYHKGEIYIHGTRKGKNVFYSLSANSMKWKELKGCPDRTISEGAPLVYQHNGREDALYLIGGKGTDKDGIYLSSSVWEYLPVHDSWNRKADITVDGKKSPLMHSGAVQYGAAHILVFGGDTGLSGFSDKIFAYHTITGTWTEAASSSIPLPVAASVVRTGDRVIMASGEIRPGVKSGEILEVRISDHVSFAWINYAVIILYLLGMMGVGFYFSRKARNTEQFFKGGSRIPWWAAGISIFATALSAITFLSIPAKAYMADWGMFMFNMAILIIVPVVIRFYLPFFRKLNVASAYQYLEERFSSPVRYLASLFFCLFMFARIAIVLFLPSLALNAVTGLDVYACILLMGLVTIAYCTMGGMEAVVWGDVIQGIILVGGAIISLIYLIAGTDGGLDTVMRISIDDHKFNILDFSFDWTRPVFWVTLLGGIANQLLTYTSDQSVVQRYITVKDTAGTKKGLWLNGILSVPVTIVFFMIGTGLYAFFKTHPELLNVGMDNTDSIFPHFIMCELPAGIAGLLIAAIFAAAMSTLSANINSTSTVMTEDFYSRLCKNATDRSRMHFARWSGVIIGVSGIIMAVMLATFDITSLWDQFNFFLGLLTSGLGGLFMMGIFTKRIGTRSALTGFAGSIVVLLLCNRYSHVSVVLYGFIGLVSCFITGYAASFLFGYRK